MKYGIQGTGTSNIWNKLFTTKEALQPKDQGSRWSYTETALYKGQRQEGICSGQQCMSRITN